MASNRSNTGQQNANSQDSALEVAGAFDAFQDLTEIDDNLDWEEVLADAWGIPYNCESPPAQNFQAPKLVQSPKSVQKVMGRWATIFSTSLLTQLIWLIWRIKWEEIRNRSTTVNAFWQE